MKSNSAPIAMNEFQKKDLIFWLSPRIRIPPYIQYKHWGIIHSFNRKKTQVYMVTNCSAFWTDVTTIIPATIEQVIRYQRRKWKTSAKCTRNNILLAKKMCS